MSAYFIKKAGWIQLGEIFQRPHFKYFLFYSRNQLILTFDFWADTQEKESFHMCYKLKNIRFPRSRAIRDNLATLIYNESFFQLAVLWRQKKKKKKKKSILDSTIKKGYSLLKCKQIHRILTMRDDLSLILFNTENHIFILQFIVVLLLTSIQTTSSQFPLGFKYLKKQWRLAKTDNKFAKCCEFYR